MITSLRGAMLTSRRIRSRQPQKHGRTAAKGALGNACALEEGIHLKLVETVGLLIRMRAGVVLVDCVAGKKTIVIIKCLGKLA